MYNRLTSFKLLSSSGLLVTLLGLLVIRPEIATAAPPLAVDAAVSLGRIRPLHGVNNGPLNQGETVDVSGEWKRAAFPVTRLHDCEWPTGQIADLHAMFPDPSADPEDAANYRFERTDAYLAPILQSGSTIVFRLGESIEHTQRKYHVHPPQDNTRWAASCLGVIRHYHGGWSGAGPSPFRYWEIWNEPENRPAMWSGTDDDYFQLYVTTARTIKECYPELKVGGPAVGATGELHDGQYQPTEFLKGFLRVCREQQAPLDLFSWHTYTSDPTVYAAKAHGLRAWLNSEGFSQTELHLNEWNYLPGNDWSPLMNSTDPVLREEWYRDMGGMPGATFVASVLISLQDSPVDVANYYSGDTSPFGLFKRSGVPKKTFYSMLAFQHLLATSERVRATSTETGIMILAGLNSTANQVQILISHTKSTSQTCELQIANVPWPGASVIEMRQLNEIDNLKHVVFPEPHFGQNSTTLIVPGEGVVLVTMQAEGQD